MDKRNYIINLFVLNGNQFTYEVSWRQRRNIVEQWEMARDLIFQSDSKRIYFKYSQVAGMILEPILGDSVVNPMEVSSVNKLGMSCK